LRKLRVLRESAGQDHDVVISFLDSPNLINCLGSVMNSRPIRIVSERNVDHWPLSLRRRATLEAYSLVDHVVSNSLTQHQAICGYGYADRASYIRNMVDLEKFKPVVSRIASKRLRGLCLASYQPHKNPSMPARALALIPDSQIDLVWYGNAGSPALRVELEQARLRAEQCRAPIVYHDHATDAAQAYADYDFVFLPSHYEGTPNVVCEAMAAGLPVVCSRVSDNPMLVQEGVNGFLFDSRDEKSFADALARIAALSEVERRQMGARNRVFAEQAFSRERFVADWMRVVETCAL
jgi:glycosyltransferase involved in cell wall biosynthesis